MDDFTNPRTVNDKREREAGLKGEAVPPAKQAAGGMSQFQFGKPFTPEEKAKQAAKLAEMLRNR